MDAIGQQALSSWCENDTQPVIEPDELVPRDVDLPNQIRLQYVAQGDPLGLPVLLLHGYSGSWRSWERMLPMLPRRLRVYALTLRGHGEASKPISGCTPGNFADDAAAFLDALGIDQAVVVGHCLGATVAESLAIRYPERVSALVLMGALANVAANRAVRELWDDSVSALTDPLDPAFVRAFHECMLSRPVPEDFLAAMVEESLKAPARVWHQAMRGMIETQLSPLRRRIACPTLLAWGNTDAFVPRAEQDRLLAEIPSAELRVYPTAGHAPHWELPERCAATLHCFTARAVRDVEAA